MLPNIESGRARVGVLSEEEETSRKFKLKLSEMNSCLNKRGPSTNENQPRPLSFGPHSNDNRTQGLTFVTSPKTVAHTAHTTNSIIKLEPALDKKPPVNIYDRTNMMLMQADKRITQNQDKRKNNLSSMSKDTSLKRMKKSVKKLNKIENKNN